MFEKSNNTTRKTCMYITYIHNVSFQLFQLDVEIILFGILLRGLIDIIEYTTYILKLKNKIKRIKNHDKKDADYSI